MTDLSQLNQNQVQVVDQSKAYLAKLATKKEDKYQLFTTLFKHKEKVKHQLQSVVNRRNYNENNLAQLDYEHLTLQEESKG